MPQMICYLQFKYILSLSTIILVNLCPFSVKTYISGVTCNKSTGGSCLDLFRYMPDKNWYGAGQISTCFFSRFLNELNQKLWVNQSHVGVNLCNIVFIFKAKFGDQERSIDGCEVSWIAPATRNPFPTTQYSLISCRFFSGNFWQK